jgi:hypothetical protein
MSANPRPPRPRSRPVLRGLRVGFAWLSLTLSVVFACLWVRSQARMDELHVGFRADQEFWGHTRRDGLRIHFQKLLKPEAQAWRWQYIAPEKQQFRGPIFPWEHDKLVAGFAFSGGRGGWALAIPHWFLTLSCAIAAVLLAPKSRWQFSLGRLLAIVTFVAVLLAIMVALSKPRS